MKFLSNLLVKAGLVVEGVTDLYAAAAVVDTDKFVVLDGNTIKYRTGSQVLSDIGAEASIPAGTTAQYWRGDKSWQTLDTTAVAEGTNLYFTDARARAAISLTTTGTSGAATYVGGVLNIPQYQAVLTNPVTGTGSAGQVAYWTGTTTQTGSNNLFFNTATGSLGIGTTTTGLFAGTTRSLTLSANGSGEIASLEIQGNRTADQTAGILSFYNGANRIAYITGTVGALTTSGVMVFFTHNAGTANEVMRLTTAGNLHVGTFVSDSGDKLQVSGAARIYSTGVGNSTVIKNNSTDASIFIGGSTMTGSTATRNVIIDPIGSYSALTGGRNYVLGRLGAVLTSASDNVFIGSHGSQLTTGTRNVFIGAHNGDSFSFDPATSRVIFISTGVSGTEGSSKAIPTGNNWAFIGGYTSGSPTNQFYFGAAPFINHGFPVQTSDVSFFAPSAIGTDYFGGDFIFNAGRGTGTGTPGDLIFRTSTATTTGTTLQTLSDRMIIAGGTGAVRLNAYGSGGRTGTPAYDLAVDSSGNVIEVAIGSGMVTGAGAAGQVTYWDSATNVTGSNNLFWDATNNRLGIGTNSPTRALQVQGTGFFADNLQVQKDFIGATTIRVGNLGTIDATTLMQFALSEDGATVNGYFRRYRNGTGLTEIGFSNALAFMGAVTGTPAERMRIFANGNIAINSTTDNGLRFQVTGDGFFSGSVGIGSSSLTGHNLRISKTITGSTFSGGIYVDGTIQSSVTSSAWGYATYLSTQAATFNIANLSHFVAEVQTWGAGSTATNQYGFLVTNSLTQATNNFGFYGNIASGTGRWNLYMNGSAANYLAGSLGIGITTTVRPLQVHVASANTVGIAITNTATTSNGLQLLVDSAGGAALWNYSNTELTIGTNNNERVRITNTGHLGLGVIPSAWGITNSTRALQLNAGSIWTFGSSSFFSGQNYFYDGTNRVYSTTAAATEYGQISGSHIWYNAPSGTAGTTATFTERMRLDASGNLGIGTTPTNALHVARTGSATLALFAATENAGIQLSRTGTSPGTTSLQQVDSGEFYLIVPQRFFIQANGANRMLVNQAGNVMIGTTTDNGQRFQVTGTSFFSDNIGLGVSNSAARLINIGKNISGSTIGFGIAQVNNVASDVTNSARIYYSEVGTQAAAFTLSELNHYYAVQGTFGAGSAVTSQYGFRVFSNLTGASINYGFYGDIASGTGRWNLYMNGTANNYMAGSLAIGSISGISDRNLSIVKALSGSVFPIGVYNTGTIASTSTNGAVYHLTDAVTENATFTLPHLYHYWARQGTFGASSTVTNQYGFFVDSSLTGATNDYGFYGNIAAATGSWNLYMNGTAANYLAGSLGIGVAAPVRTLHVNGGTGVRVSGFGVRNSTQSANSGFIQVGGSDNLYGMLDFNAFDSSTIFEVSNTNANNNAELRLGGGFITFRTSSSPTERMRLDSSGNLGLGVTPSAWSLSGSSAFQVRNTILYGSGNDGGLVSNAYFNTGFGGWYHIASARAARYDHSTGNHQWFTSTSGTAGTAVSFTQAMTLDSSGNLGLGVTPSSRLHVDAAAGSAHIRVSEAGTTRGFVGGANGIATGLNGYFMVRGEAGLVLSGNGNSSDLVIRPTTANVLIGTTTDAGFRLDVNGTMRVSGASTFARITAVTSGINLDFNAGILYHFGGSGDYYQFISGANYYISNRTATGSLILRTVDTDRLTISSTGAATFSSTVTASSNITSTDGTSSTVIQTISNAPRLVLIDGRVGGKRFDIGPHPVTSSGNFVIRDATATVNRFTIESTGDITFSNNSTALAFIPSGATVPTNGMYLPAANTLGFATNTTEDMRLTSSGNLLIATTTDTGEKLQVNGDAKITGDLLLSGTVTTATNGDYSANFSKSYAQASAISNTNLYGLVSNAVFDLTNGSYSGSATYNATSLLAQASVAGNTGTQSTQPIRSIMAGLVGKASSAAMNLADFRFIDVKAPDNGGVSGHVIGDIYGLRIAALKGATNYTITNGWGVYQEGTTDNNYFGGKVLVGTATAGSSPVRISGLPTSATGLSAGDLWNDSGTIKIA